MRALKTGEDIYLLKMEYILFLLLNGNVSAWFILFISNGVHMSLFLHLFAHIGMRKLREGDFPIGNGYYMNDYIMGLDI